MPVSKCPNGKWKIGNGGCNFTSKAKAEAAYKAYLAKKHTSKNEVIGSIKQEIDVELEEIKEIKNDLKIIRLKIGE